MLIYSSFMSRSVLSACDNKPGQASSSSPGSQCRSIHPSGPPPLQRELQPPPSQLTSSAAVASPFRCHSLPQENQQFALPRPPTSCSGASFNTEQRWVLGIVSPVAVGDAGFNSGLKQIERRFWMPLRVSLQVPAAALWSLPALPASRKDHKHGVSPLNLWWQTSVPAPPVGAPRSPRCPWFQTGAGGPSLPSLRASRSRSASLTDHF